ncbi:MAG: type II/IV secretion system ATPase subunit [Euryarchaeota archaeon]|nr:type II/IV secretion system ATPase subunit [Euryarchaeota archaeon]MBU4223402.1 type II/IV secretion system ATPase subunit [Euryarchaeota archaeon]MCG2738215.1 type II/IV secretion system ATPase subunit [Candidatus Methanoperedenaceae archaeon]
MKTLLEGINFFRLNLFPKRIPGNGNGNGIKHNSSDELELHIKQLEEQILDRKEERKTNIMETLLSFKSRPVREIDVTYPITPDHQFARIAYDNSTEELVYIPIEPLIEGREMEIFRKIRGIFESELNIESIQTNRQAYIEKKVAEIIDLYGITTGKETLDKVLYFLKRDFIGYGEIDLLMNDPIIEDISCNGPGRNVYIYHRVFESLRTLLKFEGEYRLNSFILKMAQISGRHISVLDPITDATLPEGSRINLTYSNEVTRKGSSFTIRRFKGEPISFIDLLKYGTLNAKQLAYLWLIVEYGRSILVSGGTASGKTTMLNGICLFIKPESKIVSLEDTAEINIPHENWIQSITRSGFGRGEESKGNSKRGDIGLYELLIAALRQRPEYIIVGEVRGSEAITLFQAISVGHAAMGTIHAGSMDELVNRIESFPMNVPRSQLASLDLVIFAGRIRINNNYARRAVDMVEIGGIDPATKNLITNNVFHWDPYTDHSNYSGKNILLGNIAAEHGISLEYMEKELEQREKVIDWMYRNGITHFKDVAKILKSYYYSPDELLEKVNMI